MKVLFIVQGEGRGHLTQAITMEELLRRNGHEVVEVLVGKSNSRCLPGFFNRSIQAPVKRFLSPNFLPTPANKRASLARSVAYNLTRLPVYLKSMHYIHRRIEESGAELVINFYELLTGLTYLLFRPSVPQISVGHQYMFLHRDFEFPGKKGDYLHGCMVNSGFGENIRHWHSAHPEIPLHFFWDKQDEAEVCRVDDTLSFHQLDDVKFLRYMAGCKAYATTAGFESVCEAMYLGKPLLMVPAHIEQDCNAYDAFRSGAGVISEEFDLERLLDFSEHFRPNMAFRYWVRSCDWRILRCIEREEKEETFFGVSSSCRPFFPAT